MVLSATHESHRKLLLVLVEQAFPHCGRGRRGFRPRAGEDGDVFGVGVVDGCGVEEHKAGIHAEVNREDFSRYHVLFATQVHTFEED